MPNEKPICEGCGDIDFQDCCYNEGGHCTFSGDHLDIEGDCYKYISKYDPKINPDYRSEYWIACRNRTRKGVEFVRRKRQGKRIEYKGRVFYTQGDASNDHFMYVTDGKTGYACGTMACVKRNWDKAVALFEKTADVMSLPIGKED